MWLSNVAAGIKDKKYIKKSKISIQIIQKNAYDSMERQFGSAQNLDRNGDS